MLKFLIKVPGHAPYLGLYPSNGAARADADRKFPHAPPASVLCLSRMGQRRGR